MRPDRCGRRRAARRASAGAATFDVGHRSRRRQAGEELLRLPEFFRVDLARRHLQRVGFLGDIRGTIAWIGMAAQPLGAARARFLLDRFEHPPEVARVVAGARHDLRAEEIRLLLVVAAVLEHRRAEAEAAAFRNHLPPTAADDSAGDGAGKLSQLEALGLCRVRGAMAEQHVAQLVRHDADDFALALRCLEHAAVDEHRAAGQREGVDLFQVHRRERIFEHGVVQFGRRRCYQPLAQAIEIAGERRVRDDRVLLAYFRGRLSPKLHVLFGRVLVLGHRDLRLRPGNGGVQQEKRRDATGENRSTQPSRGTGRPRVRQGSATRHRSVNRVSVGGVPSERGSGAARQTIRATPKRASPNAPCATSRPRFG